jgi:hypothetical protein
LKSSGRLHGPRLGNRGSYWVCCWLYVISKPISRHEGHLSGKGTWGHTTFNVDYVTYTQAHFIVLQQSVPVTPYVSLHVQILWSRNLKKSKDWIAREHRNNFGSWSHIQIMDQDVGVQLVDTNPDDIEIFQILASGPSTLIHRYTTYDINDYILYKGTRQHKNQPKQRCSNWCLHLWW